MKTTDELHQELMAEAEFKHFATNNETQFLSASMAERLKEICEKKQMSKAVWAKKSCISEIYLHQILSARRIPSRNRLICLCFGLGCSLDEVQQLLKLGGYAPLYPRNRRDALIEHALCHQKTLLELNGELFDNSLENLY